jgi:hypothetical protein
LGSTEAHSKLVNEVLLALGVRKDVRVWKNSTGVARSMHDDESLIRYGLVGSGDIAGFKQGGKAFFIEVKTGEAKQSKQQLNFEAVCKKFQVPYLLCRNVLDAIRFVDGIS